MSDARAAVAAASSVAVGAAASLGALLLLSRCSTGGGTVGATGATPPCRESAALMHAGRGAGSDVAGKFGLKRLVVLKPVALVERSYR